MRPGPLAAGVLRGGLAAALLLGPPAAAAPSLTVTLAVSAPPGAPVAGLEAELRWLGETHAVPLRDDGQGPDWVAGDGTWTAAHSGAPLRVLPVTLRVQAADGSWQPAYHGLERLSAARPGGPLALHWGLQRVRPAEARRLSGPGSRDTVAAASARWVGTGLAWVAACVLGLALWWRAGRRRKAGAPTRISWAQSAVLWTILGVAWTWPAATAGPGLAVGRHFDLPGTLWTLAALPRLLPTLSDPLTAWPVGGAYQRLDSFTLVPVALAGSWLSPARLHGLLQVLGVALTGLSGQWLARALGAAAPWGLLSGLVLALSGLGANALLEGHVYLMLCPFLPLLVVHWRRALGRQGRPRDGLWAGLAYCGALLTSGYLGMAGAAVVLGMLVWVLARERRLSLRAVAPAAGVVAAVGGLWLWPLLGSGGLPGDDPQAVQLASAHLASLGWATPEVDRAEHSLALALSGVMLGLVALAPAVLPRSRRWGDLAFAGGLALVLAMGPALAPGPHGTLLPLPLGALSGTGIGGLVRFPARLAWGTLVCLAPLAALVGTGLEQRLGRRARLLIPLVLVEAAVGVGLPWRQATLSTATPGAYTTGEGPVLDLFPEGLDSGGELESWSTALACLHQNGHGRPIADDCVATPVDAGPRHQIGRWLSAQLLGGDDGAVAAALGGWGFSAVAVHSDWYDPGTWARIAPGLAALDPHPVVTTDGGARVAVYRVRRQPAASWPPDTTAVAPQVGRPESALAAPTAAALRTELIVPVATADRRYLLRVHGPEGPTDRPVQNRGEAPDDLPGDRVWVDWWTGAVPTAMELEVVVVDEAGEHSGWRGPVWLAAATDRLVFRQLPGEPRRFRPVAAAPDMRNQPANRGAGAVALRGWLAVLAAGVLGGLLTRRRR